MKRLDSLRRIQHLIGIFVQDIKSSAAMGHTDVNRVAEDVLVPLFRIAFKYPNLKNLNSEEKANYPGVDLGDFEKGVAIQVTSTPTSDKIRSSLEKFVTHGLDDYFNHCRFYILTEKQKSYQGGDWGAIVDGRFKFSKDKDILDSSDLLTAINRLDAEEIYRIENFLEDTFGDGTFSSLSPPSSKEAIKPLEEIFSNILGLSFAKELYVAEMQNTSELSPQKPRSRRRTVNPPRKSANADSRKVWDALKQQGEESVRDWICFAGQLITFRDLSCPDEPLRQAVNAESIEKIFPNEFFDAGEDEERAFKFLLDRCLSMRLAPKDIIWQAEEHYYIFMPFSGGPVRKEGRRTVYSIKDKSDGSGVLYHRHLAFRTRYHRFGKEWFISITPDWYFSYDGLRKSIFHSQNVDGLKAFENNDTIFRQTQVICQVLKSDIPATLFESNVIYPYLWFEDMVSFTNAPLLNEKEWRPSESKEDTLGDLALLMGDDEDNDDEGNEVKGMNL